MDTQKKLEGINEFSERKTQKRPLIVIRRTCALKKKRQDFLINLILKHRIVHLVRLPNLEAEIFGISFAVPFPSFLSLGNFSNVSCLFSLLVKITNKRNDSLPHRIIPRITEDNKMKVLLNKRMLLFFIGYFYSLDTNLL